MMTWTQAAIETKVLMIIKIAAAFTLIVVMALKAPVVLDRPQYAPSLASQPSVTERLATTEERLRSIEEKLNQHEAEDVQAHVSDRLARIEARQEAILILLVPVALFIFTHTLELIFKMRRLYAAGYKPAASAEDEP